MKSYSQYGQDLYVLSKYFPNKRDGFFVEIGADDGIDKSNTKMFEELGWTGICVEPSPSRYGDLLKNRSCKCVNKAITDTSGKANFMDIKGYGKGLSGLVGEYPSAHLSRISEEMKCPDNDGFDIVEVECITFNELVKDVDGIDFLSIDTEGNEAMILKSIDWEKIFIKVICVEDNYNTLPEDILPMDYWLGNKIKNDKIFAR